MSRKSFVCLILSLLSLSWAVSAEAQRSRWWKDERVRRDLALTTDQVARIDAAFEAAQPALRAQQRTLSALEAELSNLVQQGQIEESELEHFVSKVEAARADLARTRTMMIYRFRRILTLEQHTKLQRLFEQREKERRGKGHGSR
jgi:Spy/CpxP family protein refolding chaperone